MENALKRIHLGCTLKLWQIKKNRSHLFYLELLFVVEVIILRELVAHVGVLVAPLAALLLLARHANLARDTDTPETPVFMVPHV